MSETAGFANTVGFNDDARSLLTIPARHDVARRVNAGYLAGLVAEHRMEESEAAAIAADLAYHLARRAFRTAAPMRSVVLVDPDGRGQVHGRIPRGRGNRSAVRRRRRGHRRANG